VIILYNQSFLARFGIALFSLRAGRTKITGYTLGIHGAPCKCRSFGEVPLLLLQIMQGHTNTTVGDIEYPFQLKKKKELARVML